MNDLDEKLAQYVPDCPKISRSVDGIGGEIKQTPEDFVVEEVPLYQPCGEGDHLFLWVEKRDLPSEALTRELARGLNVRSADVGTAGLKDRRAVTRQFVSVPSTAAAAVESFSHEQINILDAKLHGNKLKTGHLAGNRFTAYVRNVQPDTFERAQQIKEIIQQSGVPNYFGDQRFGTNYETLKLGFQLLTGAAQPKSIPFSRRRFLLRLSLSSAQSFLFNQLLARRIHAGHFDRVFTGDVMQVAESGGPFVVEDLETEQQRFDSHEIVTTGPIFGPKMRSPAGQPLEWESQLLADFELEMEAFGNFKKLTRGARRPYRVFPQELTIESENDGLRLEVFLPRGSYVTVLLDEFIKATP